MAGPDPLRGGGGGRKDPPAAVRALPPRTFLWGQQAIPRVPEYKRLVITITPDGRQDTHFMHVACYHPRECARAAHATAIARPHGACQMQHMFTAIESVQLNAARTVLG